MVTDVQPAITLAQEIMPRRTRQLRARDRTHAQDALALAAAELELQLVKGSNAQFTPGEVVVIPRAQISPELRVCPSP